MVIKNKEHLTKNGLEKILSIKYNLNKGQTDTLNNNFPNIIPMDKPLVENKVIKDPNWLTGFTDGCFIVDVYKSKTNKTGFSVKLKFSLTQHSRDNKLLKHIVLSSNVVIILKYQISLQEILLFKNLRILRIKLSRFLIKIF